MTIDLHCHSHCSDGALSPQALVDRALERGVSTLSITDHDTVAAYAYPLEFPSSFTLIPGIEFSTRWQSSGIHVLGLGIDPDSEVIKAGVDEQLAARSVRSERIAEALEKKGIPNALEGAQERAGEGFIGRPHFAQFLVDAGHVESMDKAFAKYLGDGKAGDVRQHWADLETIVSWIQGAGGIAVLAHPLKYRFTRTRLKRMLKDFIAAGGQGLEVVSGQQSPQHTQDMGRICREMNLVGSQGSDFHQPGMPWAELGSMASLPSDVVPVWESFSQTA